MKRVEDRTLSLNFRKSSQSFAAKRVRFEPIRVKLVVYYCPLLLVALLLLTTLILGFSYRQALILNIGLTVYLIYSYFTTRRAAYGIEVKRLLDVFDFTEGDEVSLKWLISNKSPIELCKFSVIDYFGPTQRGSLIKHNRTHLKAYSQIVFDLIVKCDGGMGPKKIGPIALEVNDAFGICKFVVIYDAVIDANVYPKISTIQEIKNIKVVESNHYGGYESPQSGHNVNFTGVRPFYEGDSLKHIAWKISAKQQQFMVKEFEKNVNCEVAVVLNLDPKVQIGHKNDSTWEKSREVALALVAQNIEQGHSISFLANSFFIESGQGESHFHNICKKVSDITNFDDKREIVELNNMLSSEKLIEKSKALLSHSHAVFLVVSTNKRAESIYIDFVRDLSLKGKFVHFIMINTETVQLKTPGDVRTICPILLGYSSKDLKIFLNKIRTYGAKVSLIGLNDRSSDVSVEHERRIS